MANPHTHAKSSVRRYGGILEDYIDIHTLMDSGKGVCADNRGRVFTHNAFFCERMIPLIFGEVRVNSDGRDYSPRQVSFDHCQEDYGGFIPTPGDWIDSMSSEPWMQNGKERPPSSKALGGELTKVYIG